MAASESPITVAELSRKINHHLLQSCALLAGNEPVEAMEEANFSLYLAEVRKVHYLQSKSQYYRGLCLMKLELWEEASAAFTKAASIRWWAYRVAELKAESERMIIEARKRPGRSMTGNRDVLKYL